MIIGTSQMGNGEIILLASWKHSASAGEVPVVAFSKDGSETWSDWHLIPHADGRPMMLADLGNGVLTFHTERKRFHTRDYGRTWPERTVVQPTKEGRVWHVEGNALVERDETSGQITLAATGYSTIDRWPPPPAIALFRKSYDGGRTWTQECNPQEWIREVTFEGKTYRIGVSEGSLVRSSNGWIVAALRTYLSPWWISQGDPHPDNQAGTGFSISKDNGKTWSTVKLIQPAGRTHAHFVEMKNGNLVMIYVMRRDIAPDGKRYASYRRGCAALVSQDNGQTWDVSGEYRLHEFDFVSGDAGVRAATCGHACSTVLDDGSILTAYSHYISKGIALIRWRP